MECKRYETVNLDNGAYSQWCELRLNWDEVKVAIKALEYYTDKRKLDFTERMLSGDMARQIKNCKVQEAANA